MKKAFLTLALMGVLGLTNEAQAGCRGSKEVADVGGRIYRGDIALLLREELGLIGTNCFGKEIDRIFMVASSDDLGAMAWLEVNGQRVGEFVTIGVNREKRIFELKRYHDSLDVELRSIEIRLKGVVRVDKVGVEFAGTNGGDDVDDKLPPIDQRTPPPSDDGDHAERRLRDREFRGETFLGETGFLGVRADTSTVKVESRRQDRFRSMILRAERENFEIDRMDVYFKDGAVQSWGYAMVQDGQPLRVDLIARSPIDFVIVRGRSAGPRGYDSNLTIWGLRH